MVALEATLSAVQRHRTQRDTRSKAAAWAWYQRGGGGVTASGNVEALATRRSARLAPSRFQREAAIRARLLSSRNPSSDALLVRLGIDKCSGSSSSFSHCSSYLLGDIANPNDFEDAIDSAHEGRETVLQKHSTLELVSADPAARWDCGSSLFDTFELVAMSKSLESELQEPLIDGLQESYPTCAVEDLDLGHSKQPLLLLSDTPFHLSSPPASPPPSPCEGPHNSNDTTDKLVSITDKQTKQAVYDMFCHYDDISKQATLQASKRPLAIIDAVCAGQLRKQKHRPGRMSLQGLAKALHSITHPQSQHHAISKDNGEDDSTEDYHHHHHHHHLHRNPTSQNTKGNAYQSARRRLSGDFIPTDSIADGAPLNARHVHHHHHHHYHYLFHSDDDFRLQPLDKSLMVAAAGLRSSKVNAPLHSEDDFRALQPMDKSLVVAEAGLRSSKSNSTIPRFLESPARSVDISVEYGRN